MNLAGFMLHIYNISRCLKDNATWVLRGQCIYYDTGTCMDPLDATVLQLKVRRTPRRRKNPCVSWLGRGTKGRMPAFGWQLTIGSIVVPPCRLLFRILYGNAQKELRWSLWETMANFVNPADCSLLAEGTEGLQTEGRARAAQERLQRTYSLHFSSFFLV